MSYLVAAKKPGRPKYWVFRGWTLAADGVTQTPVAWANVPLATASGPIEGRLIQPSPVTRGLPETVGGRPEFPSWTLVLDNSDRALDALLAGGTGSGRALDEYKGNSVLNLQGKLYHGVVDTDGIAYEDERTPTIAVRGPVGYDGKIATIPMAAIQDYALGHGKLQFRVEDVRKSKETNPVTLVTLAAGTVRYRDGSSGAYTQAEADQDFNTGQGVGGGWTENLSESACFVYGKCAIPTVTVQNTSNQSHVQAFGFLSLKEPYIDDWANWGIFVGSHIQPAGLRQEYLQPGDQPVIIKVQRWMQDTAGVWQSVWVAYCKIVFYSRTDVAAQDLYSGQRIWLIPTFSHLGCAVPLDPIENSATPSGIIRALIRDHGVLGASGFDSVSFEAARMAIPQAGICGGMYSGGTNIWEIASHIAQAFGLSFWVANDDTVHVLVHGTWAQADAATLAAGGLPELGKADVYGDWRESVPYGGNGQLGGPASLTTVQWSKEQQDFWDDWQLPKEAPGNTKLPLGAIVEARISGAWIYPPSADLVLSVFADRMAFATRRIAFRTHDWVASFGLGQMFLVTYDRGLEVAGSSGYSRRPMRLERVEDVPGKDQDQVAVVLEDLGPASQLKKGVLDDYANWVAKTPAVGNTLTLAAGSANVVALADIFSAADVGRTLVTRGAANEGNQGPNRKIVTVTDAKHATVNFAYPSNDVVVGDGTATIDSPWLVLENHSSAGGAFRPDFIREAKESTGLFLNGDPAFDY